jgi:divalent metal cation (Fe/Co/Zn/Cd) transporter
VTIGASTPDAARDKSIRAAFRLEYLTLGWMTMEAAVGIVAGVAAGSLALAAFGADSVIELASAGVLVWRLTVELRHGRRFAERTERLAARIGGVLLGLLALYVVIAAVAKLWVGTGAEFSWPGLVLAILAIPIMSWLARRKLQLADALGSRALRADAVESITCGWMALVVVAALLAQRLVGAWWIDPVASLGIVWFLVREAREAWGGEGCCEA